jgi:pyruvate,water dikinase
MSTRNVIWFDELGKEDIGQVGGKNASLGEMIRHLSQKGVRIPNGFATTASAYLEFLKQNHLDDRIYKALKILQVDDLEALRKTGQQIRQWIIETPFLKSFEDDVAVALEKFQVEEGDISFAVRSSATAEDLPTASFAGQQETYLNVKGLEDTLDAIKKVFASLFTDRAIAYRVHHGFEHEKVALSVGVQRMVRSDISCSGVMFSLDTESGFRDVVFINAVYGLGEVIVQGRANPDAYVLYKPNLEANRFAILRKNLGTKAVKMIYSDQVEDGEQTKVIDVPSVEQQKFVLTDDELHELARYAVMIDQYYDLPMDIEWGKDGLDGKLYILQARPETVKSQADTQILERYQLLEEGSVIVEGRSVGQRIGQGKARVLKHVSEMNRLKPGDVLVTDMTDPDWEPIMKIASAIVTNRGGRTCHAAIVARELEIPAVVGTNDATEKIKDGQAVTVSCAEGDIGYVYEGLLDFKIHQLDVGKMPALSVKIMMNIANPDSVFAFRFLPNHGVGLARLEFVINNMIGIHPNAVLNFRKLSAVLKKTVSEKIVGYNDPIDFYVSKLREGIATIAAAFYPKPVIVRTSDFKSNEYANLMGGELYEPSEDNPMLGFRGASRYVDDRFRQCFELECRALKQVRDEMGLTNVEVMIPFVRTVEEGKAVVNLMAENGLKRGENGLKIIMMCEVPSNAILAGEFLEHFDGFSIGSNDLTQLTLGLDRDSSIISHLFDERNAAVKFFLSRAIKTCNQLKKYIGICGQGPSDYPDLAKWLMQEGIGSMSLNPDTVVQTWLYIASAGNQEKLIHKDD